MIENTLTSKCVESTSTSLGEVIDIQFDVISELYSKFKTVLSAVEKNKEPFKTNYATREVCSVFYLPENFVHLVTEVYTDVSWTLSSSGCRKKNDETIDTPSFFSRYDVVQIKKNQILIVTLTLQVFNATLPTPMSKMYICDVKNFRDALADERVQNEWMTHVCLLNFQNVDFYVSNVNFHPRRHISILFDDTKRLWLT